MKKVLAIVLSVIILFGWYVTIFGIGSFGSIKDQMKLGLDLSGGVYVVMEAKTDATGPELKKLMTQTQAIIENRVNQMGLSEPVVTIEGSNRIRIELPGAKDAKEAIDSIGKTAQLQFITADNKVVLDGSQVKDAGVSLDEERGGYAVNLEFNREGADAFRDASSAIMKGEIVPVNESVPANVILIVLDGEMISNPAVSEVISGGKCSITGGGSGFTQDEATELSVLIRGGALPVALTEVETSVEGATLGLDALHMSIIAGLIGIILIFILMVVMYRIMGFAANIALTLYVLIVLWVMVAMGGVMTLPGIAGIILSVGMAVDGNVIIFSRVQEEMKNGKSVRVAVGSGFRRALATIIDSHVTTIIAAVVLYELGSGSVKGFAMTLMIGIIASLFTAVVVTQLFIDIMAENKTIAKKKYFGIKEAE